MRVLKKSPPYDVAPNWSVTATIAAARPLGAEPPSFLVLLDLFVLIGSCAVAHAIVPGMKDLLLRDMGALRPWVAVLSPEEGVYRPFGDVAWVLLVMVAVTVLCIQGTGGYRPLVWQSRTRLLLTSILAPLMGLSTITLILFTFKSPSWSRLFIFLFTLFSIAGLTTHRAILRWYRSKRLAGGFYARNVLMIGGTNALGGLVVHVAEHTSRADYDLIGYLSVSPEQLPVSYRTGLEGPRVLPCLGEVGHLPALLIHRPVHEVIAVPGGASEWLRPVVETCDYFRITLRIVPDALLTGHLRDLQLLYHSDPLRLPEIVLRPRDVDSTALFIKRLIDIAVSGVLLVLLSPLFLLIAAAIKLSTPGLPIFYRWRVVGYKGRPFTGYKFTTMAADADDRKAELESLNEMSGPVFKIKKDPRVTRLGKFLRRFSLNELPQVWSVLIGDMSLVGPRPAFPHELERYELWHKRKLSVRPGITCLWQIRGRNAINNFDDWVRMDFEDIDHWSLWLDFRILFRTAWAVVSGSGS